MMIPAPPSRPSALLPAGGQASLPLHAIGQEGLEGFAATLDPAAAAFLRASGFKAKPGQLALLPGPDGLSGAVLGLGDAPAAARAEPWTYGDLPRNLPEGTVWHLEGEGPDPAAATLGWGLGAYAYTAFKPAKREPARLVTPPGAEEAASTAALIHWVRDLINTPAADLGPAELLAAARAMAEAEGASFEAIEGDALREGFPALAAVGGGSPRAPGVGILRWEGAANGPLLALCGKGVCFDTGGLDLKPSAGMLRMKKDMGGAAVVLGLAARIIRARLPLRLLVLVGAVENSVSGEAFRPMDVLRTRKGLTVEVGNTDAEGRLVLADLLAFAAEQSPALILDCATLTGAARVALGPDLPAIFSNDDALARVVQHAGDVHHDAVWHLPLRRSYDSWLDSTIADLNNVASRPMAGAVIAALFLNRFVPAATPWLHVDLYAWNDANRPGRPEGGEAQALRALHAGISEWLFQQKSAGDETV
ncbi:leucyl aminopeptidase family protein [Roseomonas gilardii]|uniref:Leucyl aminopeptidase family protein n=1 Tax=Roseomonas gilardii TaxID=257708 RepID=A0ABU3MCQ8_9PROT|nr:leucyl aminopeptidase family protein [Roseomonas gilardii]MDT8330363.1 leucyl aminopeptidase family protein [Roseomonas gilardii]